MKSLIYLSHIPHISNVELSIFRRFDSNLKTHDLIYLTTNKYRNII